MNEIKFLRKFIIVLVIALFSTISFGQLGDSRTDTRGNTAASSEDIQRRRNEGEGVKQAMKEMEKINPSTSMFEPTPARKLEYVKMFEAEILNGRQDQLLARLDITRNTRLL